jgi:hypothetical protein
MEELNALLANPNARVAHGETGKQIHSKIKLFQQKEQEDITKPKDAMIEQLSKIQKLLEQRQAVKAAPADFEMTYQPPMPFEQPRQVYGLQSAHPILMAPQYQLSTPPQFQVSAPIMPYPQQP